MAPEEDYRPSDPVMEGRWLRALETAGIHVVRARLVQSPGGSTASISVGTEQNITKGYVERWLRDQEARIEQEQTRRYRWVLCWTIVAAVAACIAMADHQRFRSLSPMAQLILKRAAASRPSGEWNDDDYDVLADGKPRPHVWGFLLCRRYSGRGGLRGTLCARAALPQ